jgi:hypothetical protein
VAADEAVLNKVPQKSPKILSPFLLVGEVTENGGAYLFGYLSNFSAQLSSILWGQN